MVNRSEERSQPVVERIRRQRPDVSVEVVVADLADHDAIAAAAEQLRAVPPIATLHNNAGVLLDEARMSRHGIEMHAQVNTIAPYLFGRLLHDALVGATVVTTSTGGVRSARGLDVGELAAPTRFRKLVGPYTTSKVAAAVLMHAFGMQYPVTSFRSA